MLLTICYFTWTLNASLFFPGTISFADEDQLTMSFHSDNETQGLGYMVTVVQQECSLPSCDALFDQPEFVLSSPNYPLPYENGRTCTYTIQKYHPSVCRLQMAVKSFDVEDDPHCQSDFLLVNGDRMCGVMTQGQICKSFNISWFEKMNWVSHVYSVPWVIHCTGVIQWVLPQRVSLFY